LISVEEKGEERVVLRGGAISVIWDIKRACCFCPHRGERKELETVGAARQEEEAASAV